MQISIYHLDKYVNNFLKSKNLHNSFLQRKRVNDMKKKRLFLLFAIIFAFSTGIFSNFVIIDILINECKIPEKCDVINLRSSGFWDFDFIHIDNNWSKPVNLPEEEEGLLVEETLK